MSLVYLITSLPRMSPDGPPPMTRAALVEKARAVLDGPARHELELALLLEEIEETCRLMAEAEAQATGGSPSSGELTSILRTRRRQTPAGPPPSELPDWVMMPMPQHVLHRRWLHMLYQKATSPFLKGYAAFSVDLQETLTALIASREAMTKSQFLSQMEGHFDSTAEVLVKRHGGDELGIEKRHAWFPRVQAALQLEDLVEMERTLDQLRWQEYERLRGLELFSIDTVLLFYFQLRIKEREASWDRSEGERRLEAALALPHGLGMEQAQ